MLELRNISKQLGTFSLKAIDLTVNEGDYFVLLGKSGAGKTVLLELIAGLETPDEGKVMLDGKDITKQKIQDRGIGIVYQDYALFPHMNVKQNIEYALKHGKVLKNKRNGLIEHYSEITEITHLLSRDISKLSGGELQRVALARTLVKQPSCLLLDEPLSSLDVQLKSGVRKILRQINQSGVSILHVTHDYEEAIALSNKVAVLNQGAILQQGITKDVFQNPKDDFVASFTGVKNYFAATLNGSSAFINDQICIKVVNPDNITQGKIIIRGKHIIISPDRLESSSVNNFSGSVQYIIPHQQHYELIVDVGIEISVLISEESFRKYQFGTGENVWISFKANAVQLLA